MSLMGQTEKSRATIKVRQQRHHENAGGRDEGVANSRPARTFHRGQVRSGVAREVGLAGQPATHRRNPGWSKKHEVVGVDPLAEGSSTEDRAFEVAQRGHRCSTIRRAMGAGSQNDVGPWRPESDDDPSGRIPVAGQGLYTGSFGLLRMLEERGDCCWVAFGHLGQHHKRMTLDPRESRLIGPDNRSTSRPGTDDLQRPPVADG